MYEQNVLSGHNKVIQAHVQSRATGIEDKGHHVLRAVVGARPDLRIALRNISTTAYSGRTVRSGSLHGARTALFRHFGRFPRSTWPRVATPLTA